MRNIIVLVSLCVTLAMGSGVSLSAQESDVFTVDVCIDKITTTSREINMVAEERKVPLAVAGIAPTATTAVALTASEKSGRGVISFSKNSESNSGMEDDWSFTVSTPFVQGEASIASLAGLAGDIVASGSFTRFGWNLTPRSYAQDLCKTCGEVGITTLSGCSSDGISQRLQSQGKSLEEANARAEAVRGSLFGLTVNKMWGLEASVGRKERAYFVSDATKKEENREGYSFGLFGGWNFQIPLSAYARLTGKREYRENGKVNLCSPVTGGVLEECSSLPFGEAQRVESLIGSAELRRFYNNFAISPSAEYDFEAGIWGFQLPVFLLRNNDGDFTGGFKLSWRTDEEDLVGAVFVGVPLGL